MISPICGINNNNNDKKKKKPRRDKPRNTLNYREQTDGDQKGGDGGGQ